MSGKLSLYFSDVGQTVTENYCSGWLPMPEVATNRKQRDKGKVETLWPQHSYC